MGEPLWAKSAGELARLIRRREVSSREVMQAHLDRIEEVNGAVNAVTVVLAETALAAAEAADRGEPRGPLHGVPFTIKENIDCTGSSTTLGVPARAEALPPLDAPVVERMKAAGAIPLARTNMPEMGLRISTDNPLRGRTNNPFDPERTAGGSSGGEGAALATGMSPLGLGNDLGGSVRNPAYCCGVRALKPTPGRIPHAMSLPPPDDYLSYQLMAVEGPLARHTEDLRLALRVLAGRHRRDPLSVDAPLEGPAPERPRIGLVLEVPGVGLAAPVRAAVERAGAALGSAGFEVEEVAPPEPGRVMELWGHLLAADVREMLPELQGILSERPFELLQQLGQRYPAGRLSSVELHCERMRLCRAWSELFERCPVLVGPTWTREPFRHDEDLDRETGLELTLRTLAFITPANCLGLPAVAAPTGLEGGLPTGVQILADRWREDLCLAVSDALERAFPAIVPVDPRATAPAASP